jgi:hypothetical protein
MTSAINTGPINVNYPVAGVNNSSQPFRDNFASITTNLNTAGSEISDLQNKAILKAALVGTTLNNDMANAQISNALTLGFRASTFNLGNNLANTIIVDLTNGDVQYGTITADAQLQFAKWAPTGTQSNVQLILNVANTAATLNLPDNVVYGLTTIDNYLGNGATPGGDIAMPSTETQLQYTFSTIDCGTTVTISPTNIPRQAQQIVKRIVTARTGRFGDRGGDVAIGAGYGVGPVTINGGGSAYSSVTVTFSAPDVDGGTQATGTAVLSAGVITGITITRAGTGYLYAPTITITGVTGSGAVATASLTAVTNYMYFCTNDYDGTTNIWNKVATQSW